MNNKIICTKVNGIRYYSTIVLYSFPFNESDMTIHYTRRGLIAFFFFLYNVFAYSKRRILIGLQINSFRLVMSFDYIYIYIHRFIYPAEMKFRFKYDLVQEIVYLRVFEIVDCFSLIYQGRSNYVNFIIEHTVGILTM